MVEQHEQLSFPEIQPPPPEMSVDEMAAHIGKHAPAHIEIPDRTSVAAREDQRWGPERMPEAQLELEPKFEVPGQNRGRVNPYDQPVTPAEAQRGMTPEEIDRQQAINATGASAVRATLRDKSS